MKTLKVGQHYDFTVAGSDGSTIPAGTMTAVSNRPSGVSVVVNPDNTGTITALAVMAEEGPATITFSAPGYTPSTEQVMVIALPSIIVTAGPIT